MATKLKVTCFWIMLAITSIECFEFPRTDAGNYWVKPSADGEIPPGAEPFGETSTGEAIYIARSDVDGAVLPGHFIKSEGAAYVLGPDGHAEARTDYEILVGPGIWVEVLQSASEYAILGGVDRFSQPVFIGRALIEGSWIIGYVTLEGDMAVIPNVDGGYTETTNFEVLVSY